MKGKIVAVEGVDFAGKTTQVNLLDLKLRELGYETANFKFPDETTLVGSILKKVLNTQYSMPVHAFFSLFSTNRLEFKSAIERARSDGFVVLIDRYSESEYAYGVASKLPLEWLISLESQMPPADLVILLDADPFKLLQRKVREERDKFETDLSFQREVRKQYLHLAQSSSVSSAQKWFRMDAMGTVEEISTTILNVVLE